MVGRTAVALALTAAAAASAAGPVEAQALARLTVESFSLGADTNRARIDVPFHVIVALRVGQRLGRISNLQLPLLADVEVLGDERGTLADAHGTRYVEKITVVAHHGGSLTFSPATLQAIDARDGKAKQWFTNSLALGVAGERVPAMRDAARALRLVLGAAMALILVMAGLGCVAVLVFLIARRPRVIATPNPPSPRPPLVASRRDRLRDGLTVLRAEPTRANAIAIRGAVWRMLGAAKNETLGDVVALRAGSDRELQALLVALERSAFTYDEDLHDAIAATLDALARAVETAQ